MTARHSTTLLAVVLMLGGCSLLGRSAADIRRANAPARPAVSATPSPSPTPPPVTVLPAGYDPAQAATLDSLALDYVRLTLEIGTHERGYIDAYYGPAALNDAAIASPRSRDALLIETRRLMAAVAAASAAITNRESRRRGAFLVAQLRAAETRLMMMTGTRFAFADEAERLFGVRPTLQPLATYDPILADIAALVPGDGELSVRVDQWLDRFAIPADKLPAVFKTAIARCRGRTAAHISLPSSENFKLEFVTGKPWSGYNWYMGTYRSVIQVNTDLPIRLSRVIDLGCHEGYPGHHALNVKLEEELVRKRGWVEFSVYPLFSPQSLIAEGTANYGIDLAFPRDAKQATERDIIMPLAGMTAPQDDHYWRLQDAIQALQGARLTIAQMYLDGEIDRPAAVALTQKYQLMSAARAEQTVAFADKYRSYVINYGLGANMVRAHVERGNPDRDEQWRRMAALISEPTLPADLLP